MHLAQRDPVDGAGGQMAPTVVILVAETPRFIFFLTFVVFFRDARHLLELIIGHVAGEIVCEEDSFVLLVHLHDHGVVLVPNALAVGVVLLGLVVLVLDGGELNELLLLLASLGSGSLALC